MPLVNFPDGLHTTGIYFRRMGEWIKIYHRKYFFQCRMPERVFRTYGAEHKNVNVRQSAELKWRPGEEWRKMLIYTALRIET